MLARLFSFICIFVSVVIGTSSLYIAGKFLYKLSEAPVTTIEMVLSGVIVLLFSVVGVFAFLPCVFEVVPPHPRDFSHEGAAHRNNPISIPTKTTKR